MVGYNSHVRWMPSISNYSSLSAMLPRSLDTVDKILQYTAVAANALKEVTSVTQIPFLDSVCTLSLTIIPIVQVWQLDSEFHVLSHLMRL
jgi:hypothetical protein